jgi:hypothetical protein
MKITKILNDSNDDPTRGGSPRLQMFSAILLVISGLLYWWHYNPLPSDEVMIAHFQEHRAEIEELVKRYRGCVTKVGTSCEDLPENLALMEKARVKRVTDVAPQWPPNPYSIEAAKQFSKLLQAGKIPSLNPYSSIAVELLDEDDPKRHFASVLTASGRRLIFKELIFIPEVVRIEHEILWLPAHPFTGVTGKMRIYKTLDEYPSNWIKGTCVYRQFETHWFVHLCAAAV